MKKEIVKFNQWQCHLKFGYYNNNRLHIELISAVENMDIFLFVGDPIAKATVNLPDIDLKDDEIIIKNYSENEGMLETLQKFGYISDSIKEVSSGFCHFNIVKKTDKLIQLENEYQANLHIQKTSTKMKR